MTARRLPNLSSCREIWALSISILQIGFLGSSAESAAEALSEGMMIVGNVVKSVTKATMNL